MSMSEDWNATTEENAAEPMAGVEPDGTPDAAEQMEVRAAQFGPITSGTRRSEASSLDLVLDVPLSATVELGRTRMVIRDILGLGPGSVVELDKLAGEPADLLVNGRPLARGEIVVIDENFGIRITEILSPTERINTLR